MPEDETMHVIRFPKTLWVKWKAAARMIGTFQSRAILFAFYYVALAPFAVGMRLASDPLRLQPSAPRGWLPRPTDGSDIVVSSKRQF